VLLGGLLASLSVGLSVWFVLLPYLGVAAAIFMAITAASTAGLLFVPGALWVFDLLFAPGMFCRNLCPQGALLEQLGRFSLLRLVKDPARPCPAPCRACSMTCPYGLSPRDQTHHPMCDNCGRCIPRCPTAVLSRRVHLPILGMGSGSGSGMGIGAGAAVLALTLLAPLTAAAHHNKGLPHYGYYENYPQVPTNEVIAVDDRWEMGATIFNFQGYERKDAATPNDVKFFVYLYDLEANTAYVGPVEFEILLDGELVSTFTRAAVDEEVVYSTRETLPETGNYEIVAHIPGSDTDPLVEFYVDLNEDAVSWGLVLGLTLPLLPLLGLVLVGRSRKGRSLLMRDRPVLEAS
jgi:ferredoxin